MLVLSVAVAVLALTGGTPPDTGLLATSTSRAGQLQRQVTRVRMLMAFN